MNRNIIVTIGFLIASAGICLADISAPPAWGQPNHLLTSRIEIKGRQFATGKPVHVSYTVHNLAEKPTRIWHSGFYSNHQIRVCDQNGKVVALTAFGQQCFNAFSPGGARDKNFPVDIKPGGEDNSDLEIQDLNRLYDLSAPGHYSVQVLYEEYQDGWQGQLWSNVIIIQIAAP